MPPRVSPPIRSIGACDPPGQGAFGGNTPHSHGRVVEVGPALSPDGRTARPEHDGAVMFAREMPAYRVADCPGDVKVLSYACVERGGSVACGRRPVLPVGRAPVGGGCYGNIASRH